MRIDIKNFYLGTPMKYFQYMRINKKFIPQEELDEYDIIFDDQDFTYVEIHRGMYGLKEAGFIAFTLASTDTFNHHIHRLHYLLHLNIYP